MKRGFLWTDLEAEVEEEFAHLSTTPSPIGWVGREIQYRKWAAREAERLPVKWREKVEHANRSAAQIKERPAPPRKAPRPRVLPVPTKYQVSYQKRKAQAMREQLKVNDRDEFLGITHHFTILARKQVGPGADDAILKEWDGYIHAFEDKDGKLVGIDVKIAKAGSKLSGMMDGWSRLFTCALKHGASVGELCQLAMFQQFEPAGPTKNPKIPKCGSLLDYVGKFLQLRYVKELIAPDVPADVLSSKEPT